MTEAHLVTWLIENGATVTPGTPVYTIETEKVETDIETPFGGVAKLLVEADHTYPVGTRVLEIS